MADVFLLPSTSAIAFLEIVPTTASLFVTTSGSIPRSSILSSASVITADFAMVTGFDITSFINNFWLILYTSIKFV